MQTHLPLIPHTVQGQIIYQRPADGYVNATAMCLAAGKRWFDYSRLSTTGAFVDELATETGIPASVLVQTLKGGDVTMQGTWVHPQVATHLAQWLSPKFAVLVSRWVVDWMSGGMAPKRAELPYHLRRHIANQNNVPHGHFSMLSEVMISIIGPMEAMGYTLPERMLPDISMGKMFCAFLRSQRNVDTTRMPKYLHVFEDGRRVMANAYPDELLADFRKHLREVWLAKHAIPYFRPRDSEALPYLSRLLEGPKAPPKLH